MMIVFFIFAIILLWMLYEIYTSPTIDENDKIVKPSKKISDLWKRK